MTATVTVAVQGEQLIPHSYSNSSISNQHRQHDHHSLWRTGAGRGGRRRPPDPGQRTLAADSCPKGRIRSPIQIQRRILFFLLRTEHCSGRRHHAHPLLQGRGQRNSQCARRHPAAAPVPAPLPSLSSQTRPLAERAAPPARSSPRGCMASERWPSCTGENEVTMSGRVRQTVSRSAEVQEVR